MVSGGKEQPETSPARGHHPGLGRVLGFVLSAGADWLGQWEGVIYVVTFIPAAGLTIDWKRQHTVAVAWTEIVLAWMSGSDGGGGE